MRTAGVALLALGYAAQRAAAVAVSSCPDLKTEIEGSTAGTTVTLSTNIACAEEITISSGQEITIDGGSFTINVEPSFESSATDGYSVFMNEGILTLEDIVFEETEPAKKTPGVRAVNNKGTLTVADCVFKTLNERTTPVSMGGAILTNTEGSDVTITRSTFESNSASDYGGAICAEGTDILTISDCTFRRNEVESAVEESSGRGGDIYAARDVELSVSASNFTNSMASYAGSSIWCCGAVLSDCLFTGSESSLATGNYGAVTSNLPGGGSCPFSLRVNRCKFSGCNSAEPKGKGGALAIFDTSATIVETMITESTGTGLVFESSSSDGKDTLTLEVVQFNKNTLGSPEFASADGPQGTALVVTNTGVSDGELVHMGNFNGVYCFENYPYECEMVYHQADIVHDGEFKCRICNLDGEEQAPDEDDDLGLEDRDIDSSSSESQGLIIGLSLALACTLLVIGALAAYKIRVRKNARRLMEDMGDGDL